MSTNFRDRAIAEVQKAIAADNNKEYQKAFDLYMSSMELWVKALKWEKNKALKATMQEKMATYLDRAEKLKQFLAAEADNANGGKSLMGVNGSSGGKTQAPEDDDNKKLRNALSSAILQERPNVRWEDIAGLEGAKETLKEAVVLPIKFPNLFQGKRQAWKGILLYGPPGTGKSYLAKAVATEANSTFFSISSSDLVSKWMGESERLVKLLFSMARENKPSVIFIDEIDALCGPRGEGESEASRRIKTEILVQMDGVGNDSKGILVLGATNIPWQLDAAIRRRFQRRVHIGLPDTNGRARMFKLAIGDTDTALVTNDYSKLASKSDGFSGSDIANVVQHALMRPVRKILQATHFKPIMKDGNRMLLPCSPGDPEKIEMTYDDVNSDELLAPDVALKDFEMALDDSHPTVSKDDIEKQIDWTNEFGSEGAIYTAIVPWFHGPTPPNFMLTRLGDARTTVARSLRRRLPAHARAATSAAARPQMLAAKNTIAKQLDQTGVWKPAGGRRKGSATQVIDHRRVNIVSQGLCDDTIKYIGPSLERHRGCDLVDLNPGAGVWSRSLHQFLEPRKHVMMDIDADLYRPFLRDLLEKDGVELIPKSGIVWKDLFEMLRTRLAHQLKMDKGATPQRNDTLLVTANLSTFPKRSFNGFESITTMVLYQFMSSIRASSLFQQYGLVRMLLWVNDEDKRRLLPRSINRRKRSAFEAELSCEWIHEVVGHDAEFEDRYTLRDDWINVEAGYNTLATMQANGQTMPPGRETRMYTAVTGEPSLMGKQLAGARAPLLLRPFMQEMAGLEDELQDGEVDTAPVRLKNLRTREKSAKDSAMVYLGLLQEFDALRELSKKASPEEFAQADKAWNDKLDNLKKNPRNEFLIIKDGYHLFRQDPPALLWDRRAYEPLNARADEFFPNAPTALLDIQPKPMRPIFREHGPDSSRSGDMSEAMLRSWFQSTLVPIPKAMEALWGGFGSMAPECPTVKDANQFGLPMTRWGELTARAINEAQWADILQAWTNWPFRPTYEQMLGRLMDEDDDGENETKSGATGVL